MTTCRKWQYWNSSLGPTEGGSLNSSPMGLDPCLQNIDENKFNIGTKVQPEFFAPIQCGHYLVQSRRGRREGRPRRSTSSPRGSSRRPTRPARSAQRAARRRRPAPCPVRRPGANTTPSRWPGGRSRTCGGRWCSPSKSWCRARNIAINMVESRITSKAPQILIINGRFLTKIMVTTPEDLWQYVGRRAYSSAAHGSK